MITQTRLKEMLSYNQATGVFTWIKSPNKSIKVGVIAGSTDKLDGYRKICIDGHLYKAHRLAWLYTYGEWPEFQIDHINHNKCDNRLENLRDAPQAVNTRNASIYSNNTSGVAGVSWVERDNRWFAYIGMAPRTSLGYFISKDDAIAARKKAEAEHGYHANHGK